MSQWDAVSGEERRQATIDFRGVIKMSFELSFSPEFFFAEGEPYDGGGQDLPAKYPVSVWSAIESVRLGSPEKWQRIAEHFKCEPEYLCSETVLDAIRETNSCTTLTSPVEVWIDEQGYLKLDVYDDVHAEGLTLRDEDAQCEEEERSLQGPDEEWEES